MSLLRLHRVYLLLIGCACAALAGTARAQESAGQDLRGIFENANASYEAGDYPGAIDGYRRLVDAGVVDADLYYNIGNAYYRDGDLGQAVLFYMRSLRIEPRNRDARDNLELVRSQLRDKQFVRSENRLAKGIVWLHDALNAREMTLFASASYLLLCLLAIILVFADTAPVMAAYRKVSLVSPGRLIGLSLKQDVLVAMAVAFVLLATSTVSAYSKRVANRSEGVVLAEETGVFSSPTEDATLQFKIHAGTVVGVRDRRDAWVKIELPGGMSGWVSSEAVHNL
jgi:tetratricopeptide (TPR) repeat protein